jgi:hypothetical protein
MTRRDDVVAWGRDFLPRYYRTLTARLLEDIGEGPNHKAVTGILALATAEVDIQRVDRIFGPWLLAEVRDVYWLDRVNMHPTDCRVTAEIECKALASIYQRLCPEEYLVIGQEAHKSDQGDQIDPIVNTIERSVRVIVSNAVSGVTLGLDIILLIIKVRQATV